MKQSSARNKSSGNTNNDDTGVDNKRNDISQLNVQTHRIASGSASRHSLRSYPNFQVGMDSFNSFRRVSRESLSSSRHTLMVPSREFSSRESLIRNTPQLPPRAMQLHGSNTNMAQTSTPNVTLFNSPGYDNTAGNTLSGSIGTAFQRQNHHHYNTRSKHATPGLHNNFIGLSLNSPSLNRHDIPPGLAIQSHLLRLNHSSMQQSIGSLRPATQARRKTRAIQSRLLYKSTEGLRRLYKSIDEKNPGKVLSNKTDEHYPSAPNDPSADAKHQMNGGKDDKDYNYIIHVGSYWDNGRYRIDQILGRGSFGQVVKAYDTKENQFVAIKVIKNRRAFHHQAQIEINILSHLRKCDKNQSHNVVHFKEYFEMDNHLFLVFELLYINLYELLKMNQFKGVSLELVREFATQILTCLKFLSSPEVQVIHCDLKPENVMLVNDHGSSIKVADFGSSCYLSKKCYSYIQSRFYRSPEVLLGVPYGLEIDMWSLGCLLVELYTGYPLFNGCNEHEQLCKIREILGDIPAEMIRRSSREKQLKFFDSRMHLIPNKNFKPKGKSLDDIIISSNQQDDPVRHSLFVNFIRKLLDFRPAQRLKPDEALKHPFCMQEQSIQTNYQFIFKSKNAR